MRCVSISHELKVSQWPDGNELYHYKPNTADNLPINTVSWGKSGSWILLSQSYGFAEIVSLGDEAKRLNSIQNVKNTTCASFQNLTNRRVAIGTSSGQLVIYDLKSKCIKQQCPIQQTQYFKVQSSIKDSHLIGACKDGKVYIYRSNSGNLISTLSVPKSKTVTNFRCHPQKSNIVGMCSENGIVAVWDYNVDKPTGCYDAHKATVADVLIKNETIISIGADRRLSIFDYRGKKVTMEKSFTNSPTAFDLHNDGVSLAVGCMDGQVHGYDLRSMKQSTQVLAKHTSRINQILFDNFSAKTSTSTISEETTTDSAPNKSEHAESFSGMYCDVANKDIPKQTNQNVTKTRDSFMAALSINSDGGIEDSSIPRVTETNNRSRTRLQNTQISLLSSCAEDYDKKSDESTSAVSAQGLVVDVVTEPFVEEPRVINYNNNVPNVVINRKSTESLKAQSTPVNANSNMPSPIFAYNGNNNAATGINMVDLRTMLKEIVREEIQEVKEEIKNQMYEVLCSVRQNTLGLQWTLNKLSVDFEENIERLRNEVLPVEQDPPF